MSTASAPPAAGTTRAAKLVWGAVALLFVLHWDFWLWDDATLVLGFVPMGLAYQVAFSLVAALVWVLAMRFAWPEQLEAWADERQPSDAERGP